MHGFPGLVDQLASFPKPLICAVNGMALGIGATMLGLADLVFMSTEARIRCPFTALAVAPEAASSFTFPSAHGPAERQLGPHELGVALRRGLPGGGPRLAGLRARGAPR